MSPAGSRPGGSRPGGSRPGGFRSAGLGAAPWALAAAMFTAIMGAALSINGVLLGWGWLANAGATVAVVLASMAAGRSLRLPAVLVPVLGLVVLGLSLVFQFFADTAYLGIIPSGRTLASLKPLLRETSDLIVGGAVPLPVDPGLLLLCCAGLGLLAILMDLLAVSLALPAISGVALLGVLFIPALFKPDSVGPAGFAGAAAGYLLVLGCCQWYAPHGVLRAAGSAAPASQLRRAVGLGAAAVAALLIVPAVIPGFSSGLFPQGAKLSAWGTVSGLNPLITLGNDLRNPTGGGQLFYATDSFSPLYLRSSTLEDFSGSTWAPDPRDDTRRLGPVRMTNRFDSAPGVPTLTTTTQIDSPDFSSPWLPLPYAPESVLGLSGRWTWDPATMTVKALDTTTLGQNYTAISTMPQISRELLSTIATPPRPTLDPIFLATPADTPPVIEETALAITGTAPTPYDKAMALQDYLRSPAFTYSELTPLREGYDGSGLDVVAKFLEVKSGYCVHFSAAMALMAREAGIPSRIAVGYAPGTPTGKQVMVDGVALNQYVVDGHNAHAWPELYFEGLGWVPFEPTPSRGSVPPYAQPIAAPGTGPLNPDDSLNPGAALPSTATASPSAPAGPGTGAGGGTVDLWSSAGAVLGGLAGLALLASPWMWRRTIRRRRLAAIRPGAGAGGSAGALAWRELVDTAVDYGFRIDPSDTPRTMAARLLASPVLAAASGSAGGGSSSHGGAGSRAPAESPATAATAVATLLAACESAQYGPPSEDAPAGLEPALAAVRAGCARRASLPVRLRAALLPPSLFSRTRLRLPRLPRPTARQRP